MLVLGGKKEDISSQTMALRASLLPLTTRRAPFSLPEGPCSPQRTLPTHASLYLYYCLSVLSVPKDNREDLSNAQRPAMERQLEHPHRSKLLALADCPQLQCLSSLPMLLQLHQ